MTSRHADDLWRDDIEDVKPLHQNFQSELSIAINTGLLTSAEVARWTGVSAETVQSWIAGGAEPSAAVKQIVLDRITRSRSVSQ